MIVSCFNGSGRHPPAPMYYIIETYDFLQMKKQITDCQHLIDNAFSSIAGQFMNGANMGFQLLKVIVHFFHLQDRGYFSIENPIHLSSFYHKRAMLYRYIGTFSLKQQFDGWFSQYRCGAYALFFPALFLRLPPGKRPE